MRGLNKPSHFSLVKHHQRLILLVLVARGEDSEATGSRTVSALRIMGDAVLHETSERDDLIDGQTDGGADGGVLGCIPPSPMRLASSTPHYRMTIRWRALQTPSFAVQRVSATRDVLIVSEKLVWLAASRTVQCSAHSRGDLINMCMFRWGKKRHRAYFA
jgi:hypothetical protein